MVSQIGMWRLKLKVINVNEMSERRENHRHYICMILDGKMSDAIIIRKR